MFFAIHRAIIILFFAFVVGVAVWLYQRVDLRPALDWADVLKNKKSVPQVFQGQIEGTVTKVHDGDTFHLKDGQGQLYAISLIGIEAPRFEANQPKTELELAKLSRTNLASLILSNHVTVDLTYVAPSRSGLGIARMNGTNLNVVVAESGWAEVKREYIRTLPAADQVAFIQAGRNAQEGKRGLWQHP